MKSIQSILESMMAQPEFKEIYEKTVEQVVSNEKVQVFLSELTEFSPEEKQLLIQNSLAKLNEFVIETQASEHGLPVKNPGFEPVLFVNQDYIDITYIPTQEWQQRSKQNAERLLVENRMLDYAARHATLQDIFDQSESRQQILEHIIQFILNYQKSPQSAKGLYLYGRFGVGKTFILGALANELAKQGLRVLAIHYPTFLGEMRHAIQNNTLYESLQQTMKSPVLMIDDIGAENNTVWSRDDVLMPILEYRMRECLPTFFTSNFSMRELSYHFQETNAASESVKAERLMERIKFLAKEYQLVGEDLRQSK